MKKQKYIFSVLALVLLISSGFVLMRRTAVNPEVEAFAKAILKTLSAKDYAAYRKLVLSKEDALQLFQSSPSYSKLSDEEKEAQYKRMFETMEEGNVRSYFDRVLEEGEKRQVDWAKVTYKNCHETEPADSDVSFSMLEISFSDGNATHTIFFFMVTKIGQNWKAAPACNWGSQDEFWAAMTRRQNEIRDSINNLMQQRELHVQNLEKTEKPILDAMAQKQVEALMNKDTKAFDAMLMTIDDVMELLKSESEDFNKLSDEEKKEVQAHVKTEIDSTNAQWRRSFAQTIRKAEAEGIKWKKVKLDSTRQNVAMQPGSSFVKASLEMRIRYKNTNYIVSSNSLLKCKSSWKIQGSLRWEGSEAKLLEERRKIQLMEDSIRKVYGDPPMIPVEAPDVQPPAPDSMPKQNH